MSASNDIELRRVLAKLALRKIEGLKLLKPMPFQKAFRESFAVERVIRGGNRCLAGSQDIYDPVLGECRRVDSIKAAFHVLSKNPHTGEVEIKKASQPFIKAIGPLFEYRLSNGDTIRTTPQHRVLSCLGRWVGIDEAYVCGTPLLKSASCLPRSTSGIFPSVRDADDRCFSRITQGSPVRYSTSRRLCGEQPLSLEGGDRSFSPSQADVLAHSQPCLRRDDRDTSQECSHPCPRSYRPSMSRDAEASAARVWSDAVFHDNQALAPSFYTGYEIAVEAPSCFSSRQHRAAATIRGQCQDEDSEFHSSHPQVFVVGENSPITIVAATPIGVGEIWDITVEDWSNYVCGGLVNANSGKTLEAASETARAVTGQDPLDRYPKENGVCYCVAQDTDELAQVMYAKLFKPGAYFMIRDLHTNEWRSFDPTNPQDAAREREARPATPLIPKRFVKNIAWESKKEGLPKSIELTNGWKLFFYSANGKPPHGTAIDLCLAGWSEIYDPVIGKMRRIDEVDGPWHVRSWNEKTKRVETRRATKPFIKGYGEIVRVCLSNGAVIFTTRNHRVLTETNQWVSVGEAWRLGLALASEDSRLGCRAEKDHAERTQAKSQGFSPSVPSSVPHTGPQLLHRSLNEVSLRSSFSGYENGCGPHGKQKGEGCLDGYYFSLRPHGGRIPGHQESDLVFSPLPRHARGPLLSRLRLDGQAGRPSHNHLRQDKACDSVADCAEGQCYAASPLPIQESELSPNWRYSVGHGFPQSSLLGERTDREPNQHQESLSADRQEIASRFLLDPASDIGIHATYRNEQEAIRRFASRPGKGDEEPPCQGTDAAEIGQTNRERLCFSSSIQITSLETVGQSEIWDIGVEETHTYLYGGTISHNCWFDEEVSGSDWYAEIAARLVDKGGRFIWSCTPKTGTERLYALHERALDQGGVWMEGVWTGEDKRKDPTKQRTIEEFFCTIDDNKYLTESKRDVIKEKFSDDEENYRVRIKGEYARLSGRVLSDYSPQLHEIDPRPIPPHWTRYVATDPGIQVGAALFMAIPPPEEGDDAYLYDELYIRNCSAAMYGAEMAKKQGTQTFQSFLIDMHGARVRDMGGGRKVIEQYSEQLMLNKVKSIETGYEFIPGNDNVRAGIEAIKLWLRYRQDGSAKLKVFRTLTNFSKEAKHYRHKKGKDGFIDEPERKNNHLIDCLRYLVQYGPRWVAPRVGKKAVGGAIGWWRKKQEEEKKKGVGNSVLLGPGS